MDGAKFKIKQGLTMQVQHAVARSVHKGDNVEFVVLVCLETSQAHLVNRDKFFDWLDENRID